MDSIREITIDLLEKLLFQLNLLFDLENTTAYLILKPFFRNIAEDPLVFFVTIMALFLIPYTMIRVRRNMARQGKKAEKLLKKLETERTTEVPEEELELPEPESALYDKSPDTFFDEDQMVEVEEEITKADAAGDPELEFLKDLDLDSMYTKSYSMEDNQEEKRSEENLVPDEEPAESIAKDPVEDFAGSWNFAEEDGPGEPVITQLTEEDTASPVFVDELHEYPEVPGIEEPTADDGPNDNLDRMNTIDELTQQMEATIKNISNQIIEEDTDDINIPKIPAEVMDIEEEDKDSSAATFISEYPDIEGSDFQDDDEEPATTTPILPQTTDEPPLENTRDYESENQSYSFVTEETIYPEEPETETNEQTIADTGLNKVLGFPFEDEEKNENADSISANASDETESSTDTDVEPLLPKNLERSEILTPAESAEAQEDNLSTPAEPSKTVKTESIGAETSAPELEDRKETENAEKKTKLLVDRLENFQKRLEKRLTALETTLEKRKTGLGS